MRSPVLEVGIVELARLSSIGAGKGPIGLHHPDCNYEVNHSFFDCIKESSDNGQCTHDDDIAVECLNGKYIKNTVPNCIK